MKWCNPLQTIEEDRSMHHPRDETNSKCCSQTVNISNMVEEFYKFRNQKWRHSEDVSKTFYEHESCEESQLEFFALLLKNEKSHKIGSRLENGSRLRNVYLKLKKQLC